MEWLALVALAIAPAAVYRAAFAPAPAGELACGDRRKTVEPFCDADANCVWERGACRDRDGKRYFSSVAEGRARGRDAFCRCVLHTMAKGVVSPYRVCARSTGTTTGGKPCFYDFERVPMSEVREYAHRIAGIESRGLSDAELRAALVQWYAEIKRGKATAEKPKQTSAR